MKLVRLWLTSPFSSRWQKTKTDAPARHAKISEHAPGAASVGKSPEMPTQYQCYLLYLQINVATNAIILVLIREEVRHRKFELRRVQERVTSLKPPQVCNKALSFEWAWLHILMCFVRSSLLEVTASSKEDISGENDHSKPSKYNIISHILLESLQECIFQPHSPLFMVYLSQTTKKSMGRYSKRTSLQFCEGSHQYDWIENPLKLKLQTKSFPPLP